MTYPTSGVPPAPSTVPTTVSSVDLGVELPPPPLQPDSKTAVTDASTKQILAERDPIVQFNIIRILLASTRQAQHGAILFAH